MSAEHVNGNGSKQPNFRALMQERASDVGESLGRRTAEHLQTHLTDPELLKLGIEGAIRALRATLPQQANGEFRGMTSPQPRDVQPSEISPTLNQP